MSDVEDKVMTILAANARRSLEESGFDRHVLRCESPIEELMALAMWFRGTWTNLLGTEITSLEQAMEQSKELRGAVLATQVTVGSYRVDLLALWHHGDDEPVSAYAIECDGHDFHEKTKEQAARDKSRDRAITAIGVKVLRFTGSEIWRSADECAGQVLRCMHMDWCEVQDRRATRAGSNVVTLSEKPSGG